MIKNDKVASQVADYLLETRAVILRPDNPFTWASGWRSPIYCDNRVLLSYVDVRNYLRNSFVEIIKKEFSQVEVIVGVATAGIPMATMIADKMGLPLAYGRTSRKSHGVENKIEGRIEKGQKVLIVEDLISTGGSSLNVANTLKDNGIDILGLVANFNYNFEVAKDKINDFLPKFVTLCDYQTLIMRALDMEYVKQTDLELLRNWRKDPDIWGK